MKTKKGLTQEQTKHLMGVAGFILESLRRGDRGYTNILSNVAHDVMGLLDNRPFFSPRTGNWGKYAAQGGK